MRGGPLGSRICIKWDITCYHPLFTLFDFLNSVKGRFELFELFDVFEFSNGGLGP